MKLEDKLIKEHFLPKIDENKKKELNDLMNSIKHQMDFK
jgi:hypothetical protein